jgi:hypothetical protein
VQVQQRHLLFGGHAAGHVRVGAVGVAQPAVVTEVAPRQRRGQHRVGPTLAQRAHEVAQVLAVGGRVGETLRVIGPCIVVAELDQHRVAAFDLRQQVGPAALVPEVPRAAAVHRMVHDAGRLGHQGAQQLAPAMFQVRRRGGLVGHRRIADQVQRRVHRGQRAGAVDRRGQAGQVLLQPGVAGGRIHLRAVARIGRVQAVRAFPGVGQAVAVGVRGRGQRLQRRPAADLALAVDQAPGLAPHVLDDAQVHQVAHQGRAGPGQHLVVRGVRRVGGDGAVVDVAGEPVARRQAGRQMLRVRAHQGPRVGRNHAVHRIARKVRVGDGAAFLEGEGAGGHRPADVGVVGEAVGRTGTGRIQVVAGAVATPAVEHVGPDVMEPTHRIHVRLVPVARPRHAVQVQRPQVVVQADARAAAGAQQRAEAVGLAFLRAVQVQ